MVPVLLIDIYLNIADLPLFGLDVVQVYIEIRGLSLAFALHTEHVLHISYKIHLESLDLPRTKSLHMYSFRSNFLSLLSSLARSFN